ncbi:MAG: segregation/condensation protein A [Acetobacteraceae bacterium]|nr:segregation/condensation protein A [Acetobacteraceae bacterium]
MTVISTSEPLPANIGAPDSLDLRLEGFEGPLDLLLELARGQKVDLTKISILSLVEQYLAVIEGARRIRLELAADWLVMAAWLTWLKSRLLIPSDKLALEEAGVAADILAARLVELAAMRTGAAWLGTQVQLGQDVFRRAVPEDFLEFDRSRLVFDLGSLVQAYLGALRRGSRNGHYQPRPVTLWSVNQALARLGSLLGSLPDWTSLEQFLPDYLDSPLERRGALAATLLAGLEMARDGNLRLRQDRDFGPILMRTPQDDLFGGASPSEEV